MSADGLAAYLREQAILAYEFGVSDCLMLVADWIALRRGADPAAFCRGYDVETAEALLRQWGPLPRAMGRVLRRAGLRLTTAPEPGDVAVIALDNVAHAAIRTSRGWVTRLEQGGLSSLPPARVRVLAAWKI